jgi:hypothetical protein
MRHVAMTVVAAVLAAGLLGCEPTKTGSTQGTPAMAAKMVMRVNAGDEKPYTDSNGAVWLADREYDAAAKYGALGGKIVTRDTLPSLAGSKDSRLYLTEHYGLSGYRFDLPNGKYTLRLHFCETFDGVQEAGGRVFCIMIQGKLAIPNFDVFKAAGGFAKPVIKEFKNVEVTDGKLLIEFVQRVQSPEINAIEVLGE